MNNNDRTEMLRFALDLADAADEISMRYYRNTVDIEQKTDGSLVTNADRDIEEYISSQIAVRFPQHDILGEEQGVKSSTIGDGKSRWIIDPIDGTHGFARCLPVWATLIALEDDGMIEVGVASAPALGMRWWAKRGQGAYRRNLNQKAGEIDQIQVSTITNIEEAQTLYGAYGMTTNAWQGADTVLRRSWRSRGFGDFWGHCLVAEGSAELMLDPICSSWDLAALFVIVEEAGGQMTDINGRAVFNAGHAITSNGLVHKEVLEVLQVPKDG